MVIKKTTIRVNSRVTLDQFKFIKDLAKKEKIGDGEALRKIIQFYMDKK